MQALMPTTTERPPAVRRYRPLRFGVNWEKRGAGFVASYKAVFRDPKPPSWEAASYAYPLRTQWIRWPLPRLPLATSVLWHVAAIGILLLPIWRAFPAERPQPKYSDFHLTWDAPLPEIQPAAPVKPKGKTIPAGDPAKPLPRDGADAVNPRQTILTQTQSPEHPRQTLVRPDAPLTPPKVIPELPNIVQWDNSGQPPKLALSRSMLAPILKNIQQEPVDAPEISSRSANENFALAHNDVPDLKMPVNASRGPIHVQRTADDAVPQIEGQTPSAGLNLAPADSGMQSIKMPVGVNSAHAATLKRTSASIESAPEIGRSDIPSGGGGTLAANAAKVPQINMPTGSASGPGRRSANASTEAGDVAAPSIPINPQPSGGDSSLGRVIALSTNPAPPKPNIEVPKGNLSAHTSMAPGGGASGVPGGSRDANASPTSGGGAATPSAGTSIGTGPGGGNGSAGPAGVSIATSKPGATSPVSGGVGAGANTALNLHPPVTPEPAPVNPMKRRSFGPGDFDNGMAPEKIFGDKRMYTLFVNLPNLTSSSGSWVLNFAQLQPSRGPGYNDGVMSSPVAVRKVDPKYPTSLMSARVEGEVVLYAIIRADGSIDSIQVLKSLDPQLDRNAIEAVVRWKFSPAMKDGTPVDIEAVIHIPFRAPEF
jgi:TonB family protein